MSCVDGKLAVANRCDIAHRQVRYILRFIVHNRALIYYFICICMWRVHVIGSISNKSDLAPVKYSSQESLEGRDRR